MKRTVCQLKQFANLNSSKELGTENKILLLCKFRRHQNPVIGLKKDSKTMKVSGEGKLLLRTELGAGNS